MKKIILSIFLISFISSFSQEKNEIELPNTTTLTEYNYITKGYKIQKESGLDMKSGYSFGILGESKAGVYNFSFWILYKSKENSILEPRAIMLIVNNSIYFCIPLNNPTLLNEYYKEIQKYGESFNEALSVSTAKILASKIN